MYWTRLVLVRPAASLYSASPLKHHPTGWGLLGKRLRRAPTGSYLTTRMKGLTVIFSNNHPIDPFGWNSAKVDVHRENHMMFYPYAIFSESISLAVGDMTMTADISTLVDTILGLKCVLMDIPAKR